MRLPLLGLRRQKVEHKITRKLSPKKLGSRFIVFTLIGAIFVSSTIGVLLPNSASAAATKPTVLDNEIKTNLYRNALALCILESPLRDDNNIFSKQDRINEQNALAFNWFSGGVPNSVSVLAGAVLNSSYGSSAITKSGLATCSDPDFMKEAVKAIGYTVTSGDAAGTFQILCDLGFHRDSDGSSKCGTGNSGDWSRPNDSGSDALKHFLNTSTNKNVPTLSSAAKYILALNTFKTVCKTGDGNATLPTVKLAASTGVPVPVLTGTDASSFAMTPYWFTYGTTSPPSFSFFTGEGTFFSYGVLDIGSASSIDAPNQFNGTSVKTGDGSPLGNVAVDKATVEGASSAEFVYTSINIDGGIVGNSVIIGYPIFGQASSSNGTGDACGKLGNSIAQYSNAYLTWAQKPANAAQAVQLKTGSDVTTPGTPSVSTCAIDGIGWIICPVITFVSKAADGLYSFLANNFLETNTKILDTSSPTYTAWSLMRNIADVAFVIVFLIIIFSQLSGLGVTNYGVKKMLPRLIIAAILVNLSFFVCQLAVDLSNILGYSMKGIFDGLSNNILTAGSSTFNATDINGNTGFNGWSLLTVPVLVLGGAALYESLGALVPILLAAIVALLMIFFILILRQMLVILLIVVAPLAFVAYLLPNTEALFTQWRKVFTSMLLLFPIIGIVFGAATLASTVLSDAYQNSDNSIEQIIAAGIVVIPLILVPFILKASMNGVGQLGATINKLGSRAGSGAGNKYKNSNFAKHRENVKADRRGRIAAGNYNGGGLRGLRSRMNRGLNSNAALNKVTGGFGAQQALGAQAQDRKDMADAVAMFGGDDKLVKAWAASGGDTSHAAYRALPAASQAQFRNMRAAGLHNKSMSHLAAAQFLSEQGKGSTSDIVSALNRAKATGASDTVTSNAWQTSMAAYRSAGRGDIVGEMDAHQKANIDPTDPNRTPIAPIGGDAKLADAATLTAAREGGWSEVDPSSIHREALASPEGLASYVYHLGSSENNVTQALAGYDRMEGRAKALATDHILAAARARQKTKTGAPPTITTIQEAKTFFGIK